MARMDITMQRLYLAAEQIKGWKGQSEVARHLNASPQTLNNWESRGMSKRGMLSAQAIIGCSALWLETGQGDMFPGGTDSAPKVNAFNKKLWDKVVWLWNNADQKTMTMFRMMVNAYCIERQNEIQAQGLQNKSEPPQIKLIQDDKLQEK